MSTYEAKIVADSISPHGHRITSIQATFPRFILAEMNTHRVFSRNSASSRAIPVEKNIKRIEDNPFVPLAFTKNQKGMQAKEEVEVSAQISSKNAWLELLDHALRAARVLLGAGVHKQHANRLLEAFAWHTAIITATEWQNFWALRVSPDAQPEMDTTASVMKEAYDKSEPKKLEYGKWHLPYVDPGEMRAGETWMNWAKISAARCARVSTLTQEGKLDTIADLGLYTKLVTPGHMSPLEHPCRPMTEWEHDNLFKEPQYMWDDAEENWIWTGDYTYFLGNVQGWVQLRKLIPNEHNFALIKEKKA